MSGWLLPFSIGLPKRKARYEGVVPSFSVWLSNEERATQNVPSLFD